MSKEKALNKEDELKIIQEKMMLFSLFTIFFVQEYNKKKEVLKSKINYINVREFSRKKRPNSLPKTLWIFALQC